MHGRDDVAVRKGRSAGAEEAEHVLHVIRERDVGLFSLIQQVISNVAWASAEGRVPIADFQDRCCYWTPQGWEGAESVWEYYFEPLVPSFPAASVPQQVTTSIEARFPDQNDLGSFIAPDVFVTNHYGDHPDLAGRAPAIPYTEGSASAELRRWTSSLMREFIRPRSYINSKVESFYVQHLDGQDFIGVHVRGTDAVSAQETRAYRQGSLSLPRFVDAISEQLEERPDARIFVATDAQSSLDHLTNAFGERVAAYDASRHTEGDAAGVGPTGMIMPAYITSDRAAAAQNGEDAIVEFLLLTRSSHLVHNGAGLAMTVLLHDPLIPDTNTHAPSKATA